MTRLSAEDRRASILDAAIKTFSQAGYCGTTTAVLARETGVAETLIFRHFGSKAALYIACIDHAWNTVRFECDRALELESDVAAHWKIPGNRFLYLAQKKPELARVWVQAMVERTGNEAIDTHMVEILNSAHAFVEQCFSSSQKAGGLPADRDSAAEAWIIVSIGILSAVASNLGRSVSLDMQSVIDAHRAGLEPA